MSKLDSKVFRKIDIKYRKQLSMARLELINKKIHSLSLKPTEIKYLDPKYLDSYFLKRMKVAKKIGGYKTGIARRHLLYKQYKNMIERDKTWKEDNEPGNRVCQKWKDSFWNFVEDCLNKMHGNIELKDGIEGHQLLRKIRPCRRSKKLGWIPVNLVWARRHVRHSPNYYDVRDGKKKKLRDFAIGKDRAKFLRQKPSAFRKRAEVLGVELGYAANYGNYGQVYILCLGRIINIVNWMRITHLTHRNFYHGLARGLSVYETLCTDWHTHKLTSNGRKKWLERIKTSTPHQISSHLNTVINDYEGRGYKRVKATILNNLPLDRMAFKRMYFDNKDGKARMYINEVKKKDGTYLIKQEYDGQPSCPASELSSMLGMSIMS